SYWLLVIGFSFRQRLYFYLNFCGYVVKKNLAVAQRRGDVVSRKEGKWQSYFLHCERSFQSVAVLGYFGSSYRLLVIGH
ncbi:hypothetical protein, partial [Algoriphagus sp.]|uniref:hypothetical protein n=1 Tax=Algoriphagus sp. TaxID=1872435 RepID=UPI00258032B6